MSSTGTSTDKSNSISITDDQGNDLATTNQSTDKSNSISITDDQGNDLATTNQSTGETKTMNVDTPATDIHTGLNVPETVLKWADGGREQQRNGTFMNKNKQVDVKIHPVFVDTDNFVSVVKTDDTTHADYMPHLYWENSVFSERYGQKPYPKVENIPLVGVSRAEDNTEFQCTQNMFVCINDIRTLLEQAGKKPEGVFRFCDFYISRAGDNLLFEATINYEDTHFNQQPPSNSIPPLNSNEWNSIKNNRPQLFIVLKALFHKFTGLARCYFKNLIKKHYLLPEIMSYVNNGGRVRIQTDHYIGRPGGGHRLGFHKDSYSCNTFRVALSFRNKKEIFGTEIMQCHTALGLDEPNRCEEVVRFKVPGPFGTLSLNDYFLAHSSPCSISQPGSYLTNPNPVAITAAAYWRGYKTKPITSINVPKRGYTSVGSSGNTPNPQRPEFFRWWFEMIEESHFNEVLVNHQKVFQDTFQFSIPIVALKLGISTVVIEAKNTGDSLRAFGPREIIMSNKSGCTILSDKKCGGRRRPFSKKGSKRKTKRRKRSQKKRRRTKRKTFLRKRSQKKRKRRRRKTLK
jgi:hypothetical protein